MLYKQYLTQEQVWESMFSSRLKLILQTKFLVPFGIQNNLKWSIPEHEKQNPLKRAIRNEQKLKELTFDDTTSHLPTGN